MSGKKKKKVGTSLFCSCLKPYCNPSAGFKCPVFLLVKFTQNFTLKCACLCVRLQHQTRLGFSIASYQYHRWMFSDCICIENQWIIYGPHCCVPGKPILDLTSDLMTTQPSFHCSPPFYTLVAILAHWKSRTIFL